MFKLTARSVLMVGLLTLVLCGMAFAYDPNPDENDVFYPYWNRGLTATATYFWDNWSSMLEGVAATDSVIGDVAGSATINVGDGGAGLIAGDESTAAAFGTATNFLDMGPGGTMTLALDDAAAGTNGMDILVQVKYHVGIAVAPTINVRSVSGDGVVNSTAMLVSTGWYQEYQNGFLETTGTYDGQETGWMVYQTLWRLDPGQTLAGIDITSDGTYGSIIDHVVVDTQILPEPAAVILAVVGGFALILLRKVRRPEFVRN